MSDRLLFTIAPYVAALIFIAGTLVRTPGTPCPFVGGQERRGRLPWALALAVLLVAHALMWFVPDLLLAWSQSVTRVIAGEIVLFSIGVITAIGLLRVMVDVLRARRGMGVADTILLGLAAVAVGSGLVLAARYRWASTWSAVTLTPYVRSLFTFAPDASLLALPYVIKLHVFSGIAILAVLPFTSVMRPVAVALHRLRDITVAPIAAGVARQTKRIAEWAGESGRALVWPEEED
jgi:nitrate reductase gamma subunit